MRNARKRRDLREMRLDCGLTQGQLAAELGVNGSQVSRYEDGSSEPTLSGFRLLCGALGVTADALMNALDLSARRGSKRRNGVAA